MPGPGIEPEPFPWEALHDSTTKCIFTIPVTMKYVENLYNNISQVIFYTWLQIQMDVDWISSIMVVFLFCFICCHLNRYLAQQVSD